MPRAILILASLILAGCLAPRIGAPEARQTCIATTGERDYRVEVRQRPPRTLQAGEEVLVSFTGGYYDVFPACEVQGGNYVYHYPTVDELKQKPRTVEVLLDGVTFYTQECAYECALSFALPDTLTPGPHKLVVRPASWGYAPRDMEFEFEVSE